MNILKFIFALSLSSSTLIASPADDYRQAQTEAESLYIYTDVSQTAELIKTRTPAYKARNKLLEEAAKSDSMMLMLQQKLFETAKKRKESSYDTKKIKAHLGVQKNIKNFLLSVWTLNNLNGLDADSAAQLIDN